MQLATRIMIGILCALHLGYTIPETVVLMPTANLNTPRALYLSVDHSGAPQRYGNPLGRTMTMHWALNERFNLGGDLIENDPEPSQFVGSMRYVLHPETARAPSLSCGVMDLTRGAQPLYFLVSGRTFGESRWHVGMFYQASRLGWSVGCQMTLPRDWELAVEHFRAPDGGVLSSIGVAAPLNDALSLSLYYTHCHRSTDNCAFGISFSFTPLRLF